MNIAGFYNQNGLNTINGKLSVPEYVRYVMGNVMVHIFNWESL